MSVRVSKTWPEGQGMKWDGSFTIGIESIDEQHKKIFERLLAIENSVAKRDPWHILRFLLSQLADSMKFHLAVEEALLEITHYPARQEHGDAHARIIELMAELEDKLEHNAPGENLVGFFENWFVRHVLAHDREYARYMKEQYPEFAARRRP
ncbi:MAG: hemerythrin family protein [Sulfuritalea sp.]|nr:hemerythrin family protein [Sulfuritalea sp.]